MTKKEKKLVRKLKKHTEGGSIETWELENVSERRLDKLTVKKVILKRMW